MKKQSLRVSTMATPMTIVCGLRRLHAHMDESGDGDSRMARLTMPSATFKSRNARAADVAFRHRRRQRHQDLQTVGGYACAADLCYNKPGGDPK